MKYVYIAIAWGCIIVCGLGGLNLILEVIHDADPDERQLRSISTGLYLLIAVVCFGNADRLERNS